MPGFFGVIDAQTGASAHNQRQLVDIVRTMTAAMMYEPHYSEVLVSCPAVGACVGRVGFADDGESVSVNEANIVVVATGDSSSGAREMARGYRRSGEDGLVGLAGICAAFVADQTRAKCLLFNDPVRKGANLPAFFAARECSSRRKPRPFLRSRLRRGHSTRPDWPSCWPAGARSATQSLVPGHRSSRKRHGSDVRQGRLSSAGDTSITARLEQLEPAIRRGVSRRVLGEPCGPPSTGSWAPAPKVGISLTGGSGFQDDHGFPRRPPRQCALLHVRKHVPDDR